MFQISPEKYRICIFIARGPIVVCGLGCDTMSWIYAHTCIHTCVCVHPYMCACAYIYIYMRHVDVCTHTHTHIYTYMWQDELDSAWVSNFKC